MLKFKRTRLQKAFALPALLMLALTGCGPAESSREFLGSQPSGTFNTGGNTGTPGGVPGVCYRITEPVPFQGSGIQVDSNNVYAGELPGGERHGSVSMGGPNGPFTHQGQSFDGMIQMGFTLLNSGQINGVGRLTLSQEAQNDINNSGLAAQLGNPAALCVTGVAVNLGRTSMNQLYGGHVYLYFNGTTRGAVIFF
ncbi:MAG: hypothetical protein IT285_02825 [Bdellovibrionales bacterium]|nr:hypothetical protein [Bdellovibrionales bacterium]